MPQKPHKLDYARPQREKSETDQTNNDQSELKQGLSFVGLMFIAVAAFNLLANLRHGLSGPAVLIGAFGIALYVCSRLLKR